MAKDPRASSALRRGAVFVRQQSAELRLAYDSAAGGTDITFRLDDYVSGSLVGALSVVVRDIFSELSFRRSRPEEDHPARALILD